MFLTLLCVLECSKRSSRSRNKNLMMAVQVGNREINFMRSYDDVVGNLTDTHMTGTCQYQSQKAPKMVS